MSSSNNPRPFPFNGSMTLLSPLGVNSSFGLKNLEAVVILLEQDWRKAFLTRDNEQLKPMRATSGGALDARAWRVLKTNKIPGFYSASELYRLMTATGLRILMPSFADRGVSCGQRDGTPTVVNLGFLDRSRYFFHSSSSSVILSRLSGPNSTLTASQRTW
jgi:hypothetical protein